MDISSVSDKCDTSTISNTSTLTVSSRKDTLPSDTTTSSITSSNSDNNSMNLSLSDLNEELNDMDMDTEIILESVYKMSNSAFKNYGILISIFALVLGCFIVDLGTTMIIRIDITAIRRDE